MIREPISRELADAVASVLPRLLGLATEVDADGEAPRLWDRELRAAMPAVAQSTPDTDMRAALCAALEPHGLTVAMRRERNERAWRYWQVLPVGSLARARVQSHKRDRDEDGQRIVVDDEVQGMRGTVIEALPVVLSWGRPADTLKLGRLWGRARRRAEEVGAAWVPKYEYDRTHDAPFMAGFRAGYGRDLPMPTPRWAEAA